MRPRFLMCPPNYFGVKYTINPWMEGRIGTVDARKAQMQWNDFYFSLAKVAEVNRIQPQLMLPDMVFTANAGLLRNGVFIPSRFRHEERQGEEPLFKGWFLSQGYRIADWDPSVFFEGAGDALFQPGQDLLWAAHGFRTDPAAHAEAARLFNIEVISLKLVDPRFYHLDTCFCPLLDGHVFYYPRAFDAASREAIEKRLPQDKRIAIATEDAVRFACNAVLAGKNLFLNHASDDLRQTLEGLGYHVQVKPVSEFMKAGGANKCLTLELTAPGS